ncbi:MAG TPA: hypothetical protein VLQ67_10860 [Arachnia sp.]|nr:hypothetical protein [Arachnia sp.]
MKVNAICPGNFYDGPLWSDPDKGLFVQYLRSGKVPGATTVDQIRRSAFPDPHRPLADSHAAPLVATTPPHTPL